MRVSRPSGFTLVELLVVMAIVVILVITAAPNVSGWLQNSRTRSTAESVQNGLRFAQTEAARLSRTTVFSLTPSGSCAAAATGWTVTYTQIGSDSVGSTLQTSPSGIVDGPVIAATGACQLQFNSFGRVSANTADGGAFTALAADAALDVTNPNGVRRLRIEISEAGKTRMCDPDKTFSSTTPDGC